MPPRPRFHGVGRGEPFSRIPDQEVEVEKSGDTYEEKAEEAREAPGEGQGQGAAEDDETERAEK